jgi:hypothetical protein
VFGFLAHIDFKTEYILKGQVHGYTYMYEIKGITSASAEMAISSEKNAGSQRLHWGINTRTVEG